MPLSAQWNTGRLYQRDGQRIGAELAGDRRILFRDYSRMIDGEFTLPEGAPLPTTPAELRHAVMTAYDSSRGYRVSCEAGRLRWKE